MHLCLRTQTNIYVCVCVCVYIYTHTCRRKKEIFENDYFHEDIFYQHLLKSISFSLSLSIYIYIRTYVTCMYIIT